MLSRTLPLFLLISGALFPLALAPFFYWPLGLLSLAGLYLGLEQATRTRQAFYYTWLFSLGQFVVGVSWIYVSMQRFGGMSVPLAALAVLLFAAALALIPALVFAMRTHFFGPQLAWLTFPVFWFFSEWLRAHLFTGFPWLFAGDAHLFTWLAGFAPIIGSYGLSMLVALSVSLCIHSWRTRRYLLLSGLAVWPLGAYLQHMDWTHSVGELQVSAVQGNISQDQKWQPEMVGPILSTYYKATSQHWDSSLILWPETAITLVQDQFQPYQDDIADEARTHHSTIITGIAYRHPPSSPLAGEFHNSVVAFGLGEGLYHKQKLVPFGEFVPFEQQLRGLIPFFDLDMSGFLAGQPNQPLLKVGKPTEQGETLYLIAPFICYEIAYPELVANMAKNADLLVTVSNDAWFGDSLGPKQHMALAQMRALETGRYVLRATNTGITALVDQRGQIVQRLPTDVRGVLTGQAQMRQGLTPFMRAGLWPLYVVSLFILLLTILKKHQEKKACPN